MKWKSFDQLINKIAGNFPCERKMVENRRNVDRKNGWDTLIILPLIFSAYVKLSDAADTAAIANQTLGIRGSL